MSDEGIDELAIVPLDNVSDDASRQLVCVYNNGPETLTVVCSTGAAPSITPAATSANARKRGSAHDHGLGCSLMPRTSIGAVS